MDMQIFHMQHANVTPSTPYSSRTPQFAGNRPTHSSISLSSYILKPLSFVTLASCTFFESSFSSMTSFSVLSTSTSASCSVNDL